LTPSAPAQQVARDALLADAGAYGSWFATASKGRVQASAAAGLVRMHVEELMAQLDAYAARDYNQAYQIERAAYEHMFTAGVTLARASVPPELAVGLDAPPNKLRSAFATGPRSSTRPPHRSTPTPTRSPGRWGRSSGPRRPPSSSRRGLTTSGG
jgi:hypothetical protein